MWFSNKLKRKQKLVACCIFHYLVFLVVIYQDAQYLKRIFPICFISFLYGKTHFMKLLLHCLDIKARIAFFLPLLADVTTHWDT